MNPIKLRSHFLVFLAFLFSAFGAQAATVTLSNLNQTYNGAPKTVTVTTVPAGLAHTVTYNGSTTPPTNAGSYAAVATITEPGESGSASGVLTIAKASQTITFPAISNVVFNSGPVALNATASSGLAPTYSVQSGPATVGGSSATPTGAGSVTIRALQAGNANYEAATPVDRSFNVTKATATVTLGSLSHAFDGSPKSATATSNPPGLAMAITYNGSATAPSAVGSYSILATVNDTNYQGSNSGTMVISNAVATVTLGNLSQAYNGLPRTVTATTVPAGLTVTFTYDGSATAPTNAGSYAVVATVNDPSYAGSANGILVIAKATQTIVFPAIADYADDVKAVPLAATASSGLVVEYSVVSGPAAFVAGKLKLNGQGTVVVRASQPGNANYAAATNVDRSFQALQGKKRLLTIGDSFTQGGSSGGGLPLSGYREPFIRILRGQNIDGANPHNFDYSTFVDMIGSQTTTFAGIPANSDYPDSLGFDPDHEGHYGWAADDILNGNPDEPGAGKLSTWLEGYDYLPHYVLLHIGTVDALHQRNEPNVIQNARAEVGGIIDTLRAAQPSVQIWVAKIPPGNFWPFMEGNQWRAAVNAYNAMLDGLVAEKNAAANGAGKPDFLWIVDNYAGFNPDTMLDPDGLHPSMAGQTFIATNFFKSIVWSLNGGSSPPVAPAYNGAPRILTLGDEITQGGEGQHSYREPLSRMFAGQNIGGANPTGKIFTVDFVGTMTTSAGLLPHVEDFPAHLKADPQHEGHVTYTAGDILNGRPDSQVQGGFGKLGDWLDGYTPDIVLLHVGSRDAWINFELTDPNFAINTRNNIGGICVTLRAANPDVAIFLAKLIPGAFWYNDAVNAINAQLATLAADLNASSGTPYVFLVDHNAGFDAATMLAGNIHPNAAGAETMAVKWYNAISSYLSGSGLFPEINSPTTATAAVNEVFTYSITATSAPTSYGASGLPAGLTINTSTGVISGTPTALGTSNVTISATNAAGIDTETLVLTVGKATATVTLTGLSQPYTGTAKSATVVTVPAGLPVTVTYDGGAVLPVAAGSYAVVATVNDTLYQGTASGTLQITPAAQTIDFPAPASVSFAVGTVAVNATASSGLPVSFAVVSGPATVSGSTLTLSGAGSVTIRASQAGNANFAAATNVDQTLTVTKAPAVASLSGLNHTYDGVAKSVAVLTTPAGLAVTLAYDGGPTPPVAAGSYAVVATIVDANYSGSVSGTLVISKAAQTITFPLPANTTFGGSSVSLAATSSSGLPVSYSLVSGSATIAGSTVTPTGAGTVIVRALQAGNGNFLAAAPVEQSFTVTKAAAAVTLSGLSHTYDGTAKSASASTSPGSLNVGITYNGSAEAPTNAGTYEVVATINDNNYSGSAINTLTIAKAAQTLEFPVLSDVSLDVGTVELFATTSSGLPVVYTVVSGNATVNATGLTLTGAGAISVRASQPGNVNYSAATSITRIFSVGKGTQTITFPALQDVTFDIGSIPLSATSSAGLQITYTVLSGPATVSGNVLTLTGTGSISIRASQPGDANYTAATSVDRTLSVTEANATISLGNLSHTYDGTAKSVSATTLPASLAVAVTYNGNTSAPTNAGSYSVVATISTPAFSGTATGTMVINKAAATVTLSNLTHPFDGTPKAVTATTNPAGRPIVITYDGTSIPPSQMGSFAVVATVNDPNYAGSATGTLIIGSTSKLVNLSSRAQVGAGGDIMIPGFVLDGAAKKKVLIRGIGPALVPHGVSDALSQPTLRLLSGGVEVAANMGWSTAPNAADIALAADSVGAFELELGSADCALLVELDPGSYTVHLAGFNSQTGVGLVELYDVDESSTPSRLVNLSTRAQVGTGGNILIPGYAIDGTGPRQLLIRAVGPTLNVDHGVQGVLANPTLTVYKGNVIVATNDDWGQAANALQIVSTTETIGAFPLVNGSQDAAVLITLEPGVYTVQVSGVGGTAGVALVEVYEIQE